MSLYLKILKTFACSTGFVPTFFNGRLVFKTAFEYASVVTDYYLRCFISTSITFLPCLEKHFSLYLMPQSSCLHHSELQNHLIKGKIGWAMVK